MTEEADHIDDLDALPTSSAGEPDVALPSEPVKGAEGGVPRAESSTAQGDEPFDPLKIVRDVVAKSEKEAEASPAKEAEAARKAAETAPKTPDDENYTDAPFHKHPRFQQLLRERNGFKEDAGRYRNVQSFLDQNRLDANEAADALTIAGLAKTDPAKCWELLRPFAEKVIFAAGVAVPPDLQAEVDKGVLSPEVALRIAKTRSEALQAQGQLSYERQAQQRTQVQQQAQALSSTAEDWASDRQRKDPNFESKMEALQMRVLWLQRNEGRPNTPEGVKAQLDKAYKAVNETLPQPERRNGARPVTPIRGGQPSGSTREEPKSVLDIVRRAQEQASA